MRNDLTQAVATAEAVLNGTFPSNPGVLTMVPADTLRILMLAAEQSVVSAIERGIITDLTDLATAPRRSIPQPAQPINPAKDHRRACVKGRAFGASLARFTEPAIARLVAEGEPDERCKSCAFRAGTVPNGCLQTQLDALKGLLEKKPFYCHVNKYPDGSPQLCHGWYAASWARGNQAPDLKSMQWWEFSPPDPVE